jgi:hypothetical protein
MTTTKRRPVKEILEQIQHTDPTIVEMASLATHSSAKVRRAVAANPRCPRRTIETVLEYEDAFGFDTRPSTLSWFNTLVVHPNLGIADRAALVELDLVAEPLRNEAKALLAADPGILDEQVYGVECALVEIFVEHFTELPLDLLEVCHHLNGSLESSVRELAASVKLLADQPQSVVNTARRLHIASTAHSQKPKIGCYLWTAWMRLSIDDLIHVATAAAELTAAQWEVATALLSSTIGPIDAIVAARSVT